MQGKKRKTRVLPFMLAAVLSISVNTTAIPLMGYAAEVSTSVNTDSDLAYGDTSMTCDYQGKPKELVFRVVFDRNSGEAYIFMMYMDQNLDQAVRQDYLDKFTAAIDSIEYK